MQLLLTKGIITGLIIAWAKRDGQAKDTEVRMCKNGKIILFFLFIDTKLFLR
jgi:hypothetical protein